MAATADFRKADRLFIQGKPLEVRSGFDSCEGRRLVHMDDSAPDQLVRLVNPRHGHFVLESGHHGDLWLELDRLFIEPRVVARFAHELAERLGAFAVDAVCGPLTGGAFLAQAVALELGCSFIYTERTERCGAACAQDGRRVAYRLPVGLTDWAAGRRVAVVDDAINAGHAVRGSLAALRSHDARPVALGALIVTGAASVDPAMFADLPLLSIATVPGGLWQPEGCPLCAEGVPLAQREG